MSPASMWQNPCVGIQARLKKGMPAGTSSFGMSGVNAHAIFGPAEGQQQSPPPCTGPLKRLRHWPNPLLRHLLGAAKCAGSSAVFAANLLAPPLAFLADHKVGQRCTPAGASHGSWASRAGC